jgi:hypothetical protein
MSRLIVLLLALVVGVASAAAQTPDRPRAYWLRENAPELAAPQGAAVGTLAKDRQVSVYELRNGFARLTPNGAPERWVAHRALTQQKPAGAAPAALPPPTAPATPPATAQPAPRAPVPPTATDPTPPTTPRTPTVGGGRILGLPRVGEEGTTASDVDILQRAARQFIDQGRCSQVDYGDKSASKPGAYVISCDGRNIVFMPGDLK